MTGRRALALESSALLTAEGLSRVGTAVVTFALARRLGLESLAVLTVAQALLGFALVAGDAGLGSRGVARVAQGESVARVVRETSRLQLVLTLAALAVVVPISANASGRWDVTLALALVPLAYAMSAQYVLQGELALRALALARMAGNLVTAAFGLAGVLLLDNLTVVALCYGVGAFVTTVLVNFKAHVNVRLLVGRVPLTEVRDNSHRYAAMGAYTVAVHGLAGALPLLSNYLTDSGVLEQVTVAWRALQLLLLPAVVLDTQLLPRWARSAESSRAPTVRALAAAWGTGLVLSGLFAIVAPWLLPVLFGAGAADAVRPAVVLSLQVPFSMMVAVLGSALIGRDGYRFVAMAHGVAIVAMSALAVALRDQPATEFVAASVGAQALLAVVLAKPSLRAGRVARLRQDRPSRR